jgi:hypothetical protein
VLSEHSIRSKWVQEELDVGVVRAIEGRCKLIPIVLDDVDVPQPLRHRKYVVIHDASDYGKELDEIVRGIFNVSSKPGLGPPPGYVEPSIVVSGLLPTDNTVLGLAAEQAIASWSPPWNLDVNAGPAIAEAVDAPTWLAELVLEELKEKNLIGMSRGLGNLVRINQVSPVLRRELDDLRIF